MNESAELLKTKNKDLSVKDETKVGILNHVSEQYGLNVSKKDVLDILYFQMFQCGDNVEKDEYLNLLSDQFVKEYKEAKARLLRESLEKLSMNELLSFVRSVDKKLNLPLFKNGKLVCRIEEILLARSKTKNYPTFQN